MMVIWRSDANSEDEWEVDRRVLVDGQLDADRVDGVVDTSLLVGSSLGGFD